MCHRNEKCGGYTVIKGTSDSYPVTLLIHNNFLQIFQSLIKKAVTASWRHVLVVQREIISFSSK